jgi:uncharacterized phage protein (TIGR01671 family)
VYGYYIKADHHWHSHGIHEDWIVARATQNGGWFTVQNRHAVIPTSISEFTGLYDKNGKMIFEGDICQTKGYKLINEKPFEIVWNDYYSGWFWQDIEVSRETDTLTKTVAELTEVIGNIHDNPELIGGGEDA